MDHPTTMGAKNDRYWKDPEAYIYIKSWFNFKTKQKSNLLRICDIRTI